MILGGKQIRSVLHGGKRILGFTNSAANPSFETPGDAVEVRRNLLLPGGLGGTEWALVWGGQQSWRTDGRWRVLTTPGSSGVSWGLALRPHGDIPVARGDVVTLSFVVQNRSAVTSGWRIRALISDGVGNLNADMDDLGPVVSVAPGEERIVSYTLTVQQPNATSIRAGIQWVGTIATGEVWAFAEYVVEKGTSGAPFNGSYSPDPDLIPSWTGAPNASESILTATRPAGYAAGWQSGQWAAHGTKSLRVPPGAGETISPAGRVMLITPRVAGQTYTVDGQTRTTGSTPLRIADATTVTLGEGWWDQIALIDGNAYKGPWFPTWRWSDR